MTMPAGAAVDGDEQRLPVAGQQLDRLAHRSRSPRRAGNGASITSTISAPSSGGVLGGVREQAALADRADDRVRVVRADDRQLRDAVLVQQRDRVAHALRASRR